MSCGGTFTGEVIALGLSSCVVPLVVTLVTMGTGPPDSMGSSPELALDSLPESLESLLLEELELLEEEVLRGRDKGGGPVTHVVLAEVVVPL